MSEVPFDSRLNAECVVFVNGGRFDGARIELVSFSLLRYWALLIHCRLRRHVIVRGYTNLAGMWLMGCLNCSAHECVGSLETPAMGSVGK